MGACQSRNSSFSEGLVGTHARQEYSKANAAINKALGPSMTSQTARLPDPELRFDGQHRRSTRLLQVTCTAPEKRPSARRPAQMLANLQNMKATRKACVDHRKAGNLLSASVVLGRPAHRVKGAGFLLAPEHRYAPATGQQPAQADHYGTAQRCCATALAPKLSRSSIAAGVRRAGRARRAASPAPERPGRQVAGRSEQNPQSTKRLTKAGDSDGLLNLGYAQANRPGRQNLR